MAIRASGGGGGGGGGEGGGAAIIIRAFVRINKVFSIGKQTR